MGVNPPPTLDEIDPSPAFDDADAVDMDLQTEAGAAPVFQAPMTVQSAVGPSDSTLDQSLADPSSPSRNRRRTRNRPGRRERQSRWEASQSVNAFGEHRECYEET